MLPQVKLKNLLLLVIALSLLVAVKASAQQTPSPPQAVAPVKAVPPPRSPNPPPGVVIVVNRLTGAQLLAWLHRSGVEVSSIDEHSLFAPDAHASITAGFALSDGQHIVARLPQAEAEVAATASLQSLPALVEQTKTQSLDFEILLRDKEQLRAQFLGLDASSGLSVLRTELPSSPPLTMPREARESDLFIGQRVRLLAPMPVKINGAAVPDALRLRLAEVEGKLTQIARAASSGHIAKLTVRIEKSSPEIIGGAALNDANEIIGLVEAVNSGEASLVPVGSVRRAVERVIARRGNVPSPWLGVQGAPLANFFAPQLVMRGWTNAEAAALVKRQTGVLLTKVLPNTPAARGGLRSGDVIVRVNNADVRDAKDFSRLLGDAGSKAPVNFTVRRARVAPRAVTVNLNEAFNPASIMDEAFASFVRPGNLSFASNLETVALSSRIAEHFGARGGLLVVAVQSRSAAFRAGLRPYDIIETANSRLLSGTDAHLLQTLNNTESVSLSIVREHQRLSITLPAMPRVAP